MQEKIQKELQDLAKMGSDTLSHRAFDRRVDGRPLNAAQVSGAKIEYAKFHTRALNLIRRSFGIEDDHYRQLQELGENFVNYPSCLGVVDAALYAFESGLLFDMKSMIAAELLGDFIEQADTLHQAGYYIPAASLAGAVLEDTLRKLWIKRAWTLPTKISIDPLNIELAKADEYKLLTQKQITAYADIRNNADHGNPERFTPEDVGDMIRWVRRFAEERLR